MIVAVSTLLNVVVSNELSGSQPARHLANGRYLLVREVASGGMGKIWEARDSQLDRTVAIKELSADLIPPAKHAEFLERAIQEGRNAAALADHPNVVTVYDVVIEAGSPWTVMQFVRGSTLAELLKPGPAPLENVTTMAGQLLSAIRLIHNAGIVHRDIKPLNIMINTDDGRALLTDFGIAKNNHDVSLTQTGTVIGSVPYMAPERHQGDSSNPASDLFSLGVTLFEAVEGYKPFAKDSHTGTVTAILTAPLPLMQRAGRLTPLILALTEKDPRNRPTAEQAIGMLTSANLERTLGPEAFNPNGGLGGPGAPSTGVRRKKMALIAGSVAAVLAATASGAYLYSQGQYYVTQSSDNRQVLLYHGTSWLSFAATQVSMPEGPLWISSVPQTLRASMLQAGSFTSEDGALAYLEQFRKAATACTEFRHSQVQYATDYEQRWSTYCAGTTDGP